MKKSIKTIAFTLLSVGMLAGCNKPAPGPAKDWSDEVKATMTALMGEVLPYVELDEETFYFQYTYETGVVEFVVGDDNETNLVENYGQDLKAAGFKYVSMGSEAYYRKTNEAGYSISLEFGYYEATAEHPAGNEIYGVVEMPEFTSWPEELVKLIFVINDADYFDVPAFEAANATFEVDTYLYWGILPYGAQVLVYGATEAEIAAYEAKLEAAGWDYDAESGSATKAFPELDGIATIGAFAVDPEIDEETQEVVEEGYYAIIPLFSLDAIPTETWPAEKIAAAFDTLGLPAFEIPAPTSTGHTFEYRFDKGNLEYADETEPYYCYDNLYINNMSAEQFAAYGETLNAAGWEGTASAGGSNFTKHNDSAKATAQIKLAWTSSESYGDYATLRIYYVMSPDPSPDWPSEALAAAFETLGLPAFEVPAPEGEGVGFKFEFDSSNANYLDYPAYCYDNVQVYGLDADGVEAYFAKLATAGWEVSYAGSSYTEFTKHFDSIKGTATIRFYNSSASNGYDIIRIYYIVDPDPSPVWPADEIAEMLGSDVTDVLPACTFEGATFKCYNDAYGMGVSVFVGDENIAAAMEAYADTLVAAGFVQRDDGKFASKNNQFIVELYEGTDGAFGIELTFPTSVASLLNQIGAGYDLPDLSALEDKVDWNNTKLKNSYTLQIAYEGDVVESVLAALTAAGWTVPAEPTDYGYECFTPGGVMYQSGLEMDVNYYESYELTICTVYNWD